MKKIRELISNLSRWYYSLESSNKLAVTIIAVIALFLIVTFLRSIDLSKRTINYKELKPEAIIQLQKTEDRDIFMKTNDIIEKIVFATAGEYKINDTTVKVGDYRKYALKSEYKISGLKFNSRINSIGKDFLKDKKGNLEYKDIYPVIKNIYVYNADRGYYICELTTEEQHFIGLELQDEKFYIFYLE